MSITTLLKFKKQQNEKKYLFIISIIYFYNNDKL